MIHLLMEHIGSFRGVGVWSVIKSRLSSYVRKIIVYSSIYSLTFRKVKELMNQLQDGGINEKRSSIVSSTMRLILSSTANITGRITQAANQTVVTAREMSKVLSIHMMTVSLSKARFIGKHRFRNRLTLSKLI